MTATGIMRLRFLRRSTIGTENSGTEARHANDIDWHLTVDSYAGIAE